MSEQSSYQKLGVTENSSFDEIQEARHRLLQEYRGDQKRIETIEAAYDAILMDRLKMRQEGKIKVPERIRFPEKLSSPPQNFTASTMGKSPAWLQRLLDRPSLTDVLWSAGVLSALGSFVVFYPAADRSNLSLAIAFGVAFSLFWLIRKEKQFGRSILLTLVGLFLGVGLGYMLGNFILPTNMGLTLDQFATVVTFVVLWLISSFLR